GIGKEQIRMGVPPHPDFAHELLLVPPQPEVAVDDVAGLRLLTQLQLQLAHPLIVTARQVQGDQTPFDVGPRPCQLLNLRTFTWNDGSLQNLEDLAGLARGGADGNISEGSLLQGPNRVWIDPGDVDRRGGPVFLQPAPQPVERRTEPGERGAVVL